jgi:hypothetical protein
MLTVDFNYSTPGEATKQATFWALKGLFYPVTIRYP